MRYVGKVYRPPSESDAYILQASIGCSWNKCTYCDMYVDKPVFRIRELEETLDDITGAGLRFGNRVQKVFVADGDAQKQMESRQQWATKNRNTNRSKTKDKRLRLKAQGPNIKDQAPQAQAPKTKPQGPKGPKGPKTKARRPKTKDQCPMQIVSYRAVSYRWFSQIALGRKLGRN